MIFNVNAQTKIVSDSSILWKLANKSDNSLLWKISGKGLKRSSYMVFTSPDLCQTSQLLTKKLIKIQGDINIYYTETGARNPKFKDRVEKLSLLADTNQAINKLLDDAYYQKFKNKAATLKISEKEFIRYKIAGLSNMIMNDTLRKCNHPNMTEAIIRMYNTQYNLFTINELLSIEEIIENLTAYSSNYYVDLIKYLLDNDEIVQQSIKSKAQYYEEENLLGIKKLFDKHKFLNSKFENAVIFNNRINMLTNKIVPAMAFNNGGVLFSLDLNTIMNDNKSIINELKKLGYLIEPVN